MDSIHLSSRTSLRAHCEHTASPFRKTSHIISLLQFSSMEMYSNQLWIFHVFLDLDQGSTSVRYQTVDIREVRVLGGT